MLMRENTLLVIQATLWYVIFILGALVAIPTGVTTQNFNGVCVLYAQLLHHMTSPGSVSHCNYVTYSHVIFGMMFTAGMGVLYCVLIGCRWKHQHGELRKRYELDVQSKRIICLLLLVVSCAVAFLMIIASAVLSVGFYQFCDSIVTYAKKQKTEIVKSCEDAQMYYRWDQKRYGGSFYKSLQMATIAAWVGVFAWVLQIIMFFSLLRVYRHQLGIDKPRPPPSPHHHDPYAHLRPA